MVFLITFLFGIKVRLEKSTKSNGFHHPSEMLPVDMLGWLLHKGSELSRIIASSIRTVGKSKDK